MKQSSKQAIILLGPSGAGKSVQAQYLVSRHPNWVHLSSGDLLRSDSIVAKRLASGELVPSAEVERVLSQALAVNEAAITIIFDGFPRALDQAVWLDQVLAVAGRQLVAVVHIDLSLELAKQRLALRRRLDDQAGAFEIKWQAYLDKTLPVLEYYKKQGIVIAVNGASTSNKVGQTIEESLHV